MSIQFLRHIRPLIWAKGIILLLLFVFTCKTSRAQVDSVQINGDSIQCSLDSIQRSLDSIQRNIDLIKRIKDSIYISEMDSFSHVWSYKDYLNQKAIYSVRIEKKKQPFPQGWFLFFNMALIGLLLVKFFVFGEYTRKSWNAWVNNNLFFQFTREKSPVNTPIFIIDTILKLYVFSVFLLLSLYAWSGNWIFEMHTFFRIFGIFIAFYFIKYLFTFIFSLLTDQITEFKSFALNNLIFIANLAWFLVPLLFVLAYTSIRFRPFLAIGLLGIAILSYIVFLYKSFMVTLKLKVRFNFHFFIYLCGFEILPYLFLGKVLESLNFVHWGGN